MKRKYKIGFCFFSILTVVVVYFCLQEFHYPPKAELDKKANYLSGLIRKPFSSNSELMNLGNQNAEWMLFSLSFSVYAFTNIAFLDSSSTSNAIQNIDLAIQKAMTDTTYQSFCLNNPFYPQIDSTASVLYLGHLNLMLCCHRLLCPDSKYAALNDQITASLVSRYLKSKNYCLSSYPGMSWISDNSVAIASISLQSEISGDKYQYVCKEWLKKAKKDFIDPQTHLLCSRVDDNTGRKLESSRGSMVAWSIFFIYRFDPQFAKEQYQIYKDKFSANLGLFTLFKERYHHYETGNGDVNSGPLLFGYGIPSNAFAFADAVAFGDWRTAKRLDRLIQLGSKKIETGSQINYKTRFIELEVNPLAEALILYFESMTAWKIRRTIIINHNALRQKTDDHKIKQYL